MRAPTTGGNTTTHGSPGGHRILCSKCGKFQVHRASLETNGEMGIRVRCLVCGDGDLFLMRADMWIHEKLVPTLDEWADSMVASVTGLQFIKDEDGWHISRASQANPNTPSQSEQPKKGHRLFIGRPKKSMAEGVARDEFDGIDLSRIRTFGDASKVFPSDFDKARKLLERAGKVKGR